MDNHEMTVRRSKIYTYFYGKKTVFQQFLIVVGVLLFLLSGTAARVSYRSYNDKMDKLYENYREAENAYYELYREYSAAFGVSHGEEANADSMNEYYVSNFPSGTDWEDIEKDYNKALNAYQKAEEKLSDFRTKDPSDSALATICRVLGIITVLGALIWILIKKIAFNKDGEQEYDLEMNDILERAKVRGMEKLNIVAEQIDMVEPVVLNGVAESNGNNTAAKKKGFLANLLTGMLRFILRFSILVLGLLAAFVLSFVLGMIAKNTAVFVILLLAVLGLAGWLGYVMYKKHEIESFVSPKTIANLEKFYPVTMTKLGSDEKVRVSLPSVAVYMFSNEQLYVYTQYVDIVTGKIFYEGVREFFYEDIVGITSGQEIKKIFKRYGFLNLLLKSIDYMIEGITVVTKGGTYNEAYNVDIGCSLLDTQFMGMRNLVRQKKLEK